MNNEDLDYDDQIKLERHLATGGAAVVCTDRVDAWERSALVTEFQSTVTLIPFEIEERARRVVTALEACRTAGKNSVRVIIETADRHALLKVEDITHQMGLWLQQAPPEMVVEFVIQAWLRSHSNKEFMDMYKNFQTPLTQDTI